MLKEQVPDVPQLMPNEANFEIRTWLSNSELQDLHIKECIEQLKYMATVPKPLIDQLS